MSTPTRPNTLKARIVATYGHQCLANAGQARLLAAVQRGKRNDAVVGDQVELTQPLSGPTIISHIEPRSSLLFRADTQRSKALAANIDQVAIVYAPQPTYSQAFIWRALIAADAAGIEAIVVLNKTDTLSENDPAEATRLLLSDLGYTTLALSAKQQAQQARQCLVAAFRDKATLLAGQSGMGKSTILNLLVPEAAARTQAFSVRLNLGKQTTTASRWFDLPASDGGGAVVDSPGFQSFGLAHLTAPDIAQAMPDFAPHLGQCRFGDCRHLQEPDCAIRAAVNSSAIHTQRYRFYENLVHELQAQAKVKTTK